MDIFFYNGKNLINYIFENKNKFLYNWTDLIL